MSHSDVIVTGAAQTPYNRRKDGSGFRDWAASAFDAALAMAGIHRREIDALFLASESDFFSLQLNPASVLVTDLGLTGASALRCEGGGASGQLAIHAATRAIRSGAVRHAAVVGVDPSASCLPGDTMRELYGFSFDAWTDGFNGVTSTALYALSYLDFAARYGTTDADLADVTISNRSNGCKNPDAHLKLQNSRAEIADSPVIASPYRRLHCSPLSDGAAALILSRASDTPQTRASAPRIAGIGAANDHMHLGAREAPGLFGAKTLAAQRAYKDAGVRSSDIDVAEVYDAYAGAQLQSLTALGLTDNPAIDLREGTFGRGGHCPVNLSGGLLGQGAPVGATGVGQTATCALLLEGRYHSELQPPRLPRLALADTHGGICTTSAVTILSHGENR